MTSPITPELQSKIAIWRSKSADGTISLAEMREAIIALRAGRKAAIEAASASRKSSPKRPSKSADDMLGELEGL